MKIVNCLAFDVSIFTDEGKRDFITYPASKHPVEITFDEYCIGFINDIQVKKEVEHKVLNLPAPEKDTVYLVSGAVARICSDRIDLVVPSGSDINNNKKVGYTYLKKFN